MKRYDPTWCDSEVFQGMQERKEGDYVEYSDFKKYLECIAEGLENMAGLTLDTSDNEELRIMANEIRKGIA